MNVSGILREEQHQEDSPVDRNKFVMSCSYRISSVTGEYTV